jgi:hypothetical protein
MNIVTGNENEATIDPSDTYPEEMSISTKKPRLMETSTGDKEINIPKAVLIPLPPLKLTKIEKVCPNIAETPAMILTKVISSNGV